MKVEPKYLVIGLVVLGLFFWFVWPTPYYTYRKTTTNKLYRVNRITGVEQVATRDGWR